MRFLVTKSINFFVFIIGVMLITINIYGLIFDPYESYKNKFNLKDIDSIYDHIDSDFKKFGRSEKFIESISKDSKELMIYDWPENVEYMPISENWILFSMRIFDPIISRYILSDPKTLIFKNAELPDYKHAFKRRFGICSQQSLAVASLLWERYNLDARVAGLNGHVVVQVVNLNNTDYIIDPSFHTYTTGNVTQPDLISKLYLDNLKSVKQSYTTSSNNIISNRPGWGSYSKNSPFTQISLFYFTFYSYLFKWLTPIMMMIYGIHKNKLAERLPH